MSVSVEKQGDKIQGSQFYRDFCPGCGDPVRVTKDKLKTSKKVWCEECSPSHRGCGNSASCRLDDGIYDIDAFKKACYAQN